MIIHFVCVDEVTGMVDFGLDVVSSDGVSQQSSMTAPEGKLFVAVDEPFVRLEVPATTLPCLMDGKVQWIETATLDDLRARKVTEMSQACGDAILAGFTSSALGAVYDYPSNTNDQANLTGSVVRSFYSTVTADWQTPFWCSDASGVWEYRQHTAAQIQQVGDDAVVARLTCMATNERLAKQIATASAEELATIVWPA